MAKKDYYDILGIKKDATEAEIKSAFRKKAKEYHPDVNKDKGAEEKFKEIGEAYSVLGDPQKRKQYDQFGTSDFSNGGSGFSGFSGFDFDFDDLDLGSIFEQFMGGGFSSRRTNHQTRGEDLLINMELTFDEAIFGTTKSFQVNINETCDACHGEGGFDKETCDTCNGRGRVVREQRTILGVMQTETVCPKCHGEGVTYKRICDTCRGKKTTRQTKTIKLRIPKGVDSGDQMRMSGKGSSGINGGPHGDIYINFKVKKHPLFTRKGRDIYLEVPLTITEATLGTTINIPTINGTIKQTFAPGTQNNETIRLRGRGINSEKSLGIGDMYLITKVIIPNKLDRTQKSLFKELDETNLKKEAEFKNFDKYI